MIRALAPLIVFLGIGLAFAIGLTKDPSKLPSELIDRPFPEFTLSNLYDPDQSISEDIIKDQVSLINVFGSWCVACDVEHPLLMTLAEQGKLNIIGIDWRDERKKGKAWLAKRGNPYDIVIFDNESLLAIKLGITGAPETFITDKSGNIRYKHIGIITPEILLEDMLPLIGSLESD